MGFYEDDRIRRKNELWEKLKREEQKTLDDNGIEVSKTETEPKKEDESAND